MPGRIASCSSFMGSVPILEELKEEPLKPHIDDLSKQSPSLKSRVHVGQEDSLTRKISSVGPGKVLNVVSTTSAPETIEGSPVRGAIRRFSSDSSLSIREVSEPTEDRLKQLKNIIYGYATAHNKSLTWKEFEPIYDQVKTVLYPLVQDMNFLASYIVKDSSVGDNKDPSKQEKFAAYKAQIHQLVKDLDSIGIKGIEKGQKLGFWSGPAGEKKANKEHAITDSKVPFIAFLFECWTAIRKSENRESQPKNILTSQLPTLFSAIFAEFAKGSVDVYLSSKKEKQDTTSVINSDSAFWSAELYSLLKNEDVDHVNVYMHELVDGKDVWQGPYDFKNPSTFEQIGEIKITRRSHRPQTGFMEISKPIPLSSLKKQLLQWKSKAHMRAMARKNAETATPVPSTPATPSVSARATPDIKKRAERFVFPSVKSEGILEETTF